MLIGYERQSFPRRAGGVSPPWGRRVHGGLTPPARHRLGILALAILGVFAGPARADLDSGAGRPYQLHVVLDVAKHRLLTDVFKRQVKRELRDGLQAAFGELVEVKVSEEHPRLDEVRRHGLKAALDRWTDVNGVKTHFVRIDYVDGQYEVRARQHDGLTGLASPVVRRERVADPAGRPFVARLAALLVERDFGAVGTVPAGTESGPIEVKLRGGGLGVPLGRWVKKGDVFILAAILPGGNGDRGRRVEDALLVVEGAPKDGACKCRLFKRYADSLSQPGAGGYRCLKVHTVTAPLRVRILQRGANPEPLASRRVEVRRHGFGDQEKPASQRLTNSDGYFSSADRGEEVRFDGVAFVTANTEPRDALIPVPLVEDRVVVLRVNPEKRDPQSDFQLRAALWGREAFKAGQAQRKLFKELQELNVKAEQREKALGRARDALKESEHWRERLLGERDELKRAEEKEGVKLDLSFGNQWLKDLEGGHAELQRYIAKQELILKEENDPRRREWLGLIEQAKLAGDQAEYKKALELYDRAIKLGDGEGFKDEGLQQRRDDLAKKLAPKSEEHAAAQQFIYDEWPALDLMKEKEAAVKKAREMFKVCRAAGDVLTPRKLLKSAYDHAGKLKERLDILQPHINEEDRRPAEVIANLSDDLRKLIEEVKAYNAQTTGKE